MLGLKVECLEKSYGETRAVAGLSFQVEPGKIFALLGPNGAGKSSLIRMLVGLTLPDHGSITVTDKGQQIERIPERGFAYLPEDRGLYPERTVTQNLEYIGALRGLKREVIAAQLSKWLPRFDLSDKAKDKLSKLSKGNQQKVQVIACLIHQPQLLILDEPFSGLDPINQEVLLEILQELKEAGTTIVLSAHQMALVERLADHMLLLNRGEQVALGSLAEVVAQLSPQSFFQLEFADAVELSAVQACVAVAGCEQQTANNFILRLADDASVNTLLKQLMSVSEIRNFSRLQPSLHELYLRAVGAHNEKQKTQSLEGKPS